MKAETERELTGEAILISNKIDFNTKIVTRDKESIIKRYKRYILKRYKNYNLRCTYQNSPQIHLAKMYFALNFSKLKIFEKMYWKEKYTIKQ